MIVGGQTKAHASTLIDYHGLFDLALGLKGSGLMTHEIIVSYPLWKTQALQIAFHVSIEPLHTDYLVYFAKEED